MKYILIPLLKIIILILFLIIAVPAKIIWNLIMNFKWIGWRGSFTFGGGCLFDITLSDFKETFSKKATDDFCERV